jgi:hypothetical protein
MEHEDSLPSSQESITDTNLRQMNPCQTLTPYSSLARLISGACASLRRAY